MATAAHHIPNRNPHFPRAPYLAGIRVLVVDDNADAAYTLSACLTTLGHDVVTVNNARDGLAAFTERPFPLVLTDIGMPEMDGLEFTRELRRLPLGQETYVVVVSGWGSEEYRIRSHDAGVDLHLVKPLEMDQLAWLLKRWENS